MEEPSHELFLRNFDELKTMKTYENQRPEVQKLWFVNVEQKTAKLIHFQAHNNFPETALVSNVTTYGRIIHVNPERSASGLE